MASGFLVFLFFFVNFIQHPIQPSNIPGEALSLPYPIHSFISGAPGFNVALESLICFFISYLLFMAALILARGGIDMQPANDAPPGGNLENSSGKIIVVEK